MIFVIFELDNHEIRLMLFLMRGKMKTETKTKQIIHTVRQDDLLVFMGMIPMMIIDQKRITRN